ncbi:hypothetical protein, partial [Helicobacter pylori]|uniref:hypothetical protein n=1 Tax=Helicobacter pylori TaxID=210 RepID=UPI001E5EA776
PCRRFSLFEPLHRFDNPRLKKRRCLQHGAMMTQELEKAESFFRFFHKMFLKVMFYCKKCIKMRIYLQCV